MQIYPNNNQRLFMKYLLILLAVPFFAASECGKKKNKPDTTDNQQNKTDSVPACIRQLIDDGKKATPPATPLQVDEYLFKGKTVYLVTADCCDFFNVVYDDSCKAICAPSGGITGRGDGKCPEFSKDATHVKLIWKKE
jgi:hypothetical protein